MTPHIPTSDEGKCATACCFTELRELDNASDRKKGRRTEVKI